MTVAETIERIMSMHAPLDAARRTCDGVQYGDTSRECTGVVVTCSPSADVIRQAAQSGCNLIIGHEPLFYDGWDETDWLADDPVFTAKKALLDKTGIIVARNHDHLHHDRPDGIFSGLIRELGWEKWLQTDRIERLGYYFEMPKTTVHDIAVHLKRRLPIGGMRILGNAAMQASRVLICAHFLGGDWDRTQLNTIRQLDPEVIIPGEIIDWTLGAYIQDANALGKPKAVLNIGHYNLEEPGMRDYTKRVRERLSGSIPIRFVQSGDQYSWFPRENQ